MHESISSRLSHARQLAGISAKALDRLAGLTPGHTSAIENGTKLEVSAATVSKLAAALGVSIDWLVDGNRPASVA